MSGSVKDNPYLLTLPQLISAKNKVSKVAGHFDPDRYSLKGFESVGLNPTEFREQLRRNFNITLSNAELGALVYLFDADGDGLINTIEFLNEFFKLGEQEKQKQRLKQQEIVRRIENGKKKTERLRKKKAEILTASKIDQDWTEEDKTNAIRKVAKVAFSYSSAKGGIEGFLDCAALTGVEFKEQLRRNFEINLTPKEAGALMSVFDSNQNGVVDCKEFVYHFFRIRRDEINRHFEKQDYLTRKRHTKEKERRNKAIHRFGKMVLADIKPASEKDHESMLKKVTEAAAFFKPSPFVATLEKTFESAELSPTAFRELLKRNFNVKLSPGELDAAIKMFDDDKNGKISCSEFISTFFKIGLNERSRMFQRKNYRDYQLLTAQREREEKLVRKLTERTLTSVEFPGIPMDNLDYDGDSTIATDMDNYSFKGSDQLCDGKSSDIATGILLDDSQGSNEKYGDISSQASTNFSMLSRQNTNNSMMSIPESSEVFLDPSLSSQYDRSSTAPSSRSSSVYDKRRKQRTIDILSPDKQAAELAKNSISMTVLYPKASAATKDFILELEEKEREIQNMDSLRRAAKDSKSRTSSVKPGKRSVKKNIKILDPLTDVAASEEKAEVNVTEQTDENFDALPVQLPDCAFMERPNTGHAHSRGASRENKNSGLEVNWVSKDGEFGDFSYEATNSSRPSSGRVQLPPLYADDETGDCNTDPSRWEGKVAAIDFLLAKFDDLEHSVSSTTKIDGPPALTAKINSIVDSLKTLYEEGRTMDETSLFQVPTELFETLDDMANPDAIPDDYGKRVLAICEERGNHIIKQVDYLTALKQHLLEGSSSLADRNK